MSIASFNETNATPSAESSSSSVTRWRRFLPSRSDQPVRHFGALTLEVESCRSGNTYTLDVELDGLEVERIYFPKGGWVSFNSCELDEDYTGECEDSRGRAWAFHGMVKRSSAARRSVLAAVTKTPSRVSASPQRNGG